jgi:hypothetical protein
MVGALWTHVYVICSGGRGSLPCFIQTISPLELGDNRRWYGVDSP